MVKLIPLILLLIACSPTEIELQNYCLFNGWVKENKSLIRKLDNELENCMFVSEKISKKLRNCRL